jgi:hypothetical protein
MMLQRTVNLAFAAACLAAIAATPAHAQMASTYGSAPGYNGQQSNASPPNRGDMAQSPSAHLNVIQSQHYDRSLATNHRFRQTRMRKECGPITDPQLRQSCLASFNQD